MDMTWVINTVEVIGGFMTAWMLIDRGFDYFIRRQIGGE